MRLALCKSCAYCHAEPKINYKTGAYARGRFFYWCRNEKTDQRCATVLKAQCLFKMRTEETE
jgi:hypothetical protein